MSSRVKVKNKIGIKEKEDQEEKVNFLSIWKQFWNPDSEELTEEEVILQDETLSIEDKKELIKALKNRDKMINTIFKNSYKTTNIKADARESARKVLKENPIHIETKTGEITRENDRKTDGKARENEEGSR